VLLELPVLALHLLIPFLIFSCSLAMNLARRPGTVVTDDTVMTFWAGLCLSFLFLFFFTIFDKTPRLDFPARNGLIFSFYLYDDGWQYGIVFPTHQKMYECASNPQKRERDKRTQVQLYLHR
jgi:hypothetical protein